MGVKVNYNAAQSKVKCGRFIDGKEGFKFHRKYQETNSVKKLKFLSMVPKGLNTYKLNHTITKLNQ